MTYTESELHTENDPEFNAIKDSVELSQFIEFMKDKDLHDIRLPLNNPEAYKYLRWLNFHYLQDSNYINYLLNIWDGVFDKVRVRPPTHREMAIVHAKAIVKANTEQWKQDDKEFGIDVNAELIRDTYYFSNYHVWVSSGLAGCVLKWGTFEENEPSENKYITYEEYNK